MNDWQLETSLVDEFIESLTVQDQARLIVDLDLLSEFGPAGVVVKKLSGGIWELKSGRIRLFFCGISRQQIRFVHAIVKKTNKTPLKDLKLAGQRCK